MNRAIICHAELDESLGGQAKAALSRRGFEVSQVLNPQVMARGAQASSRATRPTQMRGARRNPGPSSIMTASRVDSPTPSILRGIPQVNDGLVAKLSLAWRTKHSDAHSGTVVPGRAFLFLNHSEGGFPHNPLTRDSL